MLVWASPASAVLLEDFSDDPFIHWSLADGPGFSSGNQDVGGVPQFEWSLTPPAYATDSAGSLTMNLDSTLATGRLDRPLGAVHDDTQDFILTVQFSFNLYIPGQSCQIAFGLTNSTTTGATRTSDPSNTFSTIAFNYFPGTDPTLQQVAFGADVGSGNAFDNYAVIFGNETLLSDNFPPAITALPENTNLQATLFYTAADSMLSIVVSEIASNGDLIQLDTGVPAMDLSTTGNYNSFYGFEYDQISLMAYYDSDNYTDPLTGEVVFQEIYYTVPEPHHYAVHFSLICLAAFARRKSGTAPSA